MFLRPIRSGFTLLELCVSMFLVMLLIAVALPSLTGELAQRRLQQAFDRFDAFVAQAQTRSMSENQPYVLVWTSAGRVLLYPSAWNDKERAKRGPVASLPPPFDGSRYTLTRKASLTQNPPAVWTVWPTGNCEPVSVGFQSGAGVWDASYSALSGRGTILRFLAR